MPSITVPRGRGSSSSYVHCAVACVPPTSHWNSTDSLTLTRTNVGDTEEVGGSMWGRNGGGGEN